MQQVAKMLVVGWGVGPSYRSWKREPALCAGIGVRKGEKSKGGYLFID